MAIRGENVLVIALMLVGLGLTGIGGWLTLANWNALSWPTVEGRVVHSGVHRSGFSNHSPSVTYEYAVGERSYTGSRLRHSWGTRRYDAEGSARHVSDAYPVGRTVTVRYDPDDPARSYLLRELAFGNLLLLALGIAMVGLPLALLIEFNRRPRHRRAHSDP